MEFLAACIIMTATMYDEPQSLACGGKFNPDGWTVANKDKVKYPCGTEAFVSYKDRTVKVTVNDDGPHNKNDLDLSGGAAKALKFPGTGKVCFQLVSKPLSKEGTTHGRKKEQRKVARY